MRGLYNQTKMVNNCVLILLSISYAVSFYVYHELFFLEIYYRLALGIFTAILVFGPTLYGLYSQSIKKSMLLAVIVTLPFLWMALIGYDIMIEGGFRHNFYMFVGSNLFSFIIFLVTGILTAWLGATYQPDQIKEIGFKSFKIPVFSLMILVMLLIFSFMFLITGSLPFGFHIH